MAKKQETVLTEVAGKIGSALGMIAAEASKVVRPLRESRSKRSHAHPLAAKKRGTMSGRATPRRRNVRKRTRRSL
jgi:hypothetical protein